GARSVTAADIDRDGDLDVVGAAGGADTVAWWENTDGGGTSWTKRSVDVGFGGAHDVSTADVDGDGDLDILGTAETDGQVSWWENLSGDGTAWAEHIVTATFAGAISIAAEDLDGDGDLDLFGTARDADTVSWFENLSGDGTAWSEHVVEATFTGTTSAAAGDIDGDGAPDLLATSFDLDDLAWWQNLGGQFALPTADAVAGATPREGTADVVLLQIDAVHRGRSGDGDLELSTFELLFEATAGDSLTNGELAALVDTVRLYQDDGDGIFETDGSDTEIYSAAAPFGLASGVLTVSFAAGAAEAQITVGDSETYFVAVDLAAAAAGAVPNTLRLTHLTSSSSTARMASTGLPLTLEYLADTSASTITAVGNPEITVSPTSLDFGVQWVSGGATASQQVTITNDGSGELTLHSVALVGIDAAAFSDSGDTGEATWAPGQSRTVDLAFDPSDPGIKSAALRILSDDADESSVDVALAGVGVEPEITVSPLSLSFDAVDVGSQGVPQSVTITNDGSAALTLTAVTLTGDGAAHFQITDDSGEVTLEPGETRSLDLAFAPTESGSFVAGLSLTSNDVDEATVDVVLSGDSADWIFGDGFESGDLTAWSATIP
ncbi:MAG: choice-of-anchor D domain-containing protein, partial [Acidobacteriota bacterium]